MEVKPFRAYRFNSSVVGDVGDCIAPPYDVISPNEQEKLYQTSSYNIVRIIKGKSLPEDSEKNNVYTRAAGYLDEWISKGALKQDSQDTLYAYVQGFDIGQQRFRRGSFVGWGRLEEFGKIVRPHEETLNRPKVDRLNLQRATVAKFGLVLVLYQDKQKIADKIICKAMESNTLIDFTDEQSVRHRLFAIEKSQDVEAIVDMIQDKSCIIADGHHRYETGLNYYRETGNPAAAYQMMAFVNAANEGLVVLATHRLVYNLEQFSCEQLADKLSEHFDIRRYKFGGGSGKEQAKQQMLSGMKTEFDKGEIAFGFYCGDGSFDLAVLKDKTALDSIAPQRSAAWRSLDVSVLHKLILERLLGIDEQRLAAGENVEYIKDTSIAVDASIGKVDRGQRQVAVFMNPLRIEQLTAVTAAGEKMPQKSTFFYPKVYTGLTIHKL